MGCDGGTIPKRDELVRTKKKPEQKDKTADLVAKWKYCAISQEPLRQPLMGCELGRLYNKEAILEFLLDTKKFECASNFDHLRNLKDLKQLVLTENPADRKSTIEKGDAYIDTQSSQYICPVVGLEMNGKYKFCFMWSCGCVISQRALNHVKSDVCHKCGKSFNDTDVIVINGSEEDVEQMRGRMEQRKLQAKLERKAKRAVKKKSEASLCDSAGDGGASSSKQIRLDDDSATGLREVNPSTHSKAGRLNGDHKLDPKKMDSNGKNRKRNIQKDPSASVVYKSLFTTSEAAKNKPSAHWVTYNPLYF